MISFISIEQSFDAWGRKRNPADWTYESIPATNLLYRGYTFHEHLDEFGLINMNGRAYDPIVGRFLNPDPVLQNPSDIQNYNRYSYCLNNPLKYTDPSGYMYENNISNRFRFAHSINRNLEKLLFSNALNAEMWSSGFMGSLCSAMGMSLGNGIGGTDLELNGMVGTIEWPGIKFTYHGFYEPQLGGWIYPELLGDDNLRRFVNRHFGQIAGLRTICYVPTLGNYLGVTTYRGKLTSDVEILSAFASDPKALYVVVGHEIIHVKHYAAGLYEYCIKRNIPFDDYSENVAYAWSDGAKVAIGLDACWCNLIAEFEVFERKRCNKNGYPPGYFQNRIELLFQHYSKF